jgi:hypothetical protein
VPYSRYDHREFISYLPKKLQFLGLTLDEMKSALEDNLRKTGCNDLSVMVFSDITIIIFSEFMRQTNHLNYHYLINFNRLPLFGEDVGHHSPIGGYVEDNDSVCIRCFGEI